MNIKNTEKFIIKKDALRNCGYSKLKYMFPILSDSEAVKQVVILTFPNDVKSSAVLPSGPHIVYQVPVLQGKQHKVLSDFNSDIPNMYNQPHTQRKRGVFGMK